MKDIKTRKAFGKKLRKTRLSQGLTQEILAEKVGIHRTYIGMIERGEQSVSLDNINRLAKALRVKVSDLLP